MVISVDVVGRGVVLILPENGNINVNTSDGPTINRHYLPIEITSHMINIPKFVSSHLC